MPSTEKLDTHHKALTLNLDPSTFGSFAEIGAGQEVARWFLVVGGASGTVAKTISAYDKEVSDDLYGSGSRYVSRQASMPCWIANGLSYSTNWTKLGDRRPASSVLWTPFPHVTTPEQTKLTVGSVCAFSASLRAKPTTFFCISTCRIPPIFSNRRPLAYWV